LILRLLGVRVVLTLHNLHSHESNDPVREIGLIARIAAFSSLVAVHSASAAGQIRAKYPGMSARAIVIIEHPNYDGCYATRDEVVSKFASCESSNINVLYFGNIRPYKGVEEAVAAIARISRSDVCLTVAGSVVDDRLKGRLVDAARRDGRISLKLGKVSDECVFKLFYESDVVIVPFRRTLTSGSVILALTLGRPVISTMEAKVLDLIDETNGYLCDFDTMSELLRSINRRRLIEMRSAARETADRLAQNSIGPKLTALYRA